MTNGSQAPDLTAFQRAVFLAGEVDLGLDVHDIELVEAAWSIPDAVASSHGWVVDGFMSSTPLTTAAAGSRRSLR